MSTTPPPGPTPPGTKVDPFSDEVEVAGRDTGPSSESKSARGSVLSMKRSVVIGTSVVAFILLGVVILSATYESERVRELEEAADDEIHVDRVELDPTRTRNEADHLLDEALVENEKAQEDEKAEQPSLEDEGSPPGAPDDAPTLEQPTTEPADPAAPVDPWEQARAQHRATLAQAHYQNIRAARRAPLFFGSGSPISGGGQGRRSSGGGEPDSEDSRELAAFRASLKGIDVRSARPEREMPNTPQVGGALGAREREAAFFEGQHATRRAPAGRPTGDYVEAWTMVHAVLLSRLDSTLPGQVIARVSHPVWDRNIERILIPSGSKLLGLYNARTRPGQARMQVAWTMLIMPDGREIALASLPGVDFAGTAGLEAKVDEHWDDLLAGAALAGIFSASAAIISGPTNALNTRPDQQALYGSAGAIQQAGEGLTERALAIEPTLELEQGARVAIMVTQDLRL